MIINIRNEINKSFFHKYQASFLIEVGKYPTVSISYTKYTIKYKFIQENFKNLLKFNFGTKKHSFIKN